MKVLLVDDHPLILAALQSVIRGLGDDVSVVGAPSAAAARAALEADPERDLVLLDLRLGDENGFDLLAELRANYPAVPVVIVSASDRASDVIQAIDLGAMGFVPKRASNDVLFEALRLVMQGGIYVPPMTMGLQGTGEGATVPSHPDRVRAPGGGGDPLAAIGLTPRQTDVLGLLLQGQPKWLDSENPEGERGAAGVAASLFK